MKRFSLLFVLLTLIISQSVQALDWAISFVVWEGDVYEVNRDEMVEESEIGKRIGKVRTQPNGMTGRYYGDASNAYPKGTLYYEIKGMPTSKAIAVKDEDRWVKAVYIHKAPFHVLNIFYNAYFQFTALIMILLIILFRIQKFKKTTISKTGAI